MEENVEEDSGVPFSETTVGKACEMVSNRDDNNNNISKNYTCVTKKEFVCLWSDDKWMKCTNNLDFSLHWEIFRHITVPKSRIISSS